MNSKIKPVSFANLEAYTNHLKAKYAKKADIPTQVSTLTNDAKYQSEEQVTAAINAKVSSTYKAGGSVAFADLPELTSANLGLVVNVNDNFTTNDQFVEGAGKKHPAGTNVAVVAVTAGEGDAQTTSYKYDVLAGFVDLSGYLKAEDVEEITAEEIAALFEE